MLNKMLKSRFIDRNEEIKFLEERYKNKNFEFFVIYGRRRVGKTELIKSFLKNKPHIYFLCDKSGTKRNVYRFKKKISEFLVAPSFETLRNIRHNANSGPLNLSTQAPVIRKFILFRNFVYRIGKYSCILPDLQVLEFFNSHLSSQS